MIRHALLAVLTLAPSISLAQSGGPKVIRVLPGPEVPSTVAAFFPQQNDAFFMSWPFLHLGTRSLRTPMFTQFEVDPNRGTLITAGEALQVWDIKTAQVKKTLGQPEDRHETIGVDWVHQRVAGYAGYSINDGQFHLNLFDLKTGAALGGLPAWGPDELTALTFSPDGEALLAGGEALYLWTGPGLQHVRKVESTSRSPVAQLAFTGQGKAFWTVHKNGEVHLWNLSDTLKWQKKVPLPAPVSRMQATPDGSKVAVAFLDGKTVLYGPALQSARTLFTADHPANALKFSSNNTHLLVCPMPCVKVDLSGSAPIQKLNGAMHYAHEVFFSPQGDLFVGHLGQELQRWDTRNFQKTSTMPLGTGTPYGNVYGQKLALPAGASIQIWDLSTQRLLKTLRVPSSSKKVERAVLVNDNTLLSLVPDAGELRLWDIQKGTSRVLASNLMIHQKSFAGLVHSPGVLLASDGHLDLLTVKGNQVVRKQAVKQQVWGPLAVSSDERLLAADDRQQDIQVLDLKTGQVKRTFPGREKGKYRYALKAFSPDGQLLAVATSSRLEVWDLGTGKQVYQKTDFGGEIQSMAYAQNGRMLAVSVGPREGGAVTVLDVSMLQKNRPSSP